MEAGQKIYFEEEKRPYTIRAITENFAICTKPFNLRKTVIYTIVDFNKGIRGTDSYVFSPYNYFSDENCEKALKELEETLHLVKEHKEKGVVYCGGMEVNHRNNIPLNIKKK